MVLNPAGLQIAYDFGNPQIISGRAREAISGGQLCYISGATGVFSSGANSFDPVTDILVLTGASGTEFAGVALANAGSNDPVSLIVGGAVISTAGGTITNSINVGANGGDAVIGTATAGRTIGRSYGSAGSEGYVLWHIGRT